MNTVTKNFKEGWKDAPEYFASVQREDLWFAIQGIFSSNFE